MGDRDRTEDRPELPDFFFRFRDTGTPESIGTQAHRPAHRLDEAVARTRPTGWRPSNSPSPAALTRSRTDHAYCVAGHFVQELHDTAAAAATRVKMISSIRGGSWTCPRWV